MIAASTLVPEPTRKESTNQVLQWSHADLTFDGNNLYADQESIDLAAAAGLT